LYNARIDNDSNTDGSDDSKRSEIVEGLWDKGSNSNNRSNINEESNNGGHNNLAMVLQFRRRLQSQLFWILLMGNGIL
jgi:hypothetical protein